MQVQGMGTHCQVSSQFIKKDLQFFGRVPISPREGLEPGSPDPETSALPVAPSEPLLEVVVLSIFIYVIYEPVHVSIRFCSDRHHIHIRFFVSDFT